MSLPAVHSGVPSVAQQRTELTLDDRVEADYLKLTSAVVLIPRIKTAADARSVKNTPQTANRCQNSLHFRRKM